MLQNFIRSLRGGIDALAKMHEARLLMECIHMSRRYKETPQFRLETLSNRLVGEIEEGYSNYVALSSVPARFTGSFIFQALYGDGQIRLRSAIRPSEPARPRRQQPILAREGPVPGLEPPSGGVVTTMTGPATVSALDNASETGPQRYTGLPLPPPRTGVVREAYQFVASQDSRTSAIIPCPANRGTSLRFRHDKDPLLDWGLWRMFKPPMVGWWRMRNPELDWFLGGPRFELWNLKDKTPKRLRPNRETRHSLLARQKNWWCHMNSGMSGSAWLESGSTWLVSGSTWLESGSTWLESGGTWLVSGSTWLESGGTWLVSGSAWSVTGSRSAWSVTGSRSAWSVTGSRSCGSVRMCRAWSELCVFCHRMACMFCWLSMKLLQFCVSGSSHCDELPRLTLRKLSSLEPGRELFGVAVWILEDLSGRCWIGVLCV